MKKLIEKDNRFYDENNNSWSKNNETIESATKKSILLENCSDCSDCRGCVVGLKWKRIGDRKAEAKVLKSCFVVDPLTDERCSVETINVQVENVSSPIVQKENVNNLIEMNILNNSIYNNISVMV